LSSFRSIFVKTKTACVTCPLLFLSGSWRAPIGAKKALKMCDIESIKNTRFIVYLPDDE
jgi:hypothetical protein